VLLYVLLDSAGADNDQSAGRMTSGLKAGQGQ